MTFNTPPLAPSVIRGLHALGLFTVTDLREFDPCHAFLLLKKQQKGITQSVFWQLIALCENRQPENLTETQRIDWQTKLQNYPPVAIFPQTEEMVFYMKMALQEAQLAALKGEIPVGAVIVRQNQVLAKAHNLCVAEHSVCRHAEIQAIEQSGKFLQNYRLNDCDLYITLEPCAMCASAILQARIGRVIFAAPEPKTGAAGSVLNLFTNKQLNSHTAVKSGILADESRAILQTFFAARRKK